MVTSLAAAVAMGAVPPKKRPIQFVSAEESSSKKRNKRHCQDATGPKKRQKSIEEDPRDPPAPWPAPIGDARKNAPLWMQQLCGMSNKFHSKECDLHKAEVKKATENNLKLTRYCVTCQKGPLCIYGAENDHKGPAHVVLQVRRTSKKASVNVADLLQADPSVDYWGVVEYVINSKPVFFLEFKHQDKCPKGSKLFCKQCRRSLPKRTKEDKCKLLCQPRPDLFCSLPCKGHFMRGDVNRALHPEHASLSWIKILDTDRNAGGRRHHDDDVGPGQEEEELAHPKCSTPSSRSPCLQSLNLEQLPANSEAPGQIHSSAEEPAVPATVVAPTDGAPAHTNDDCSAVALEPVKKKPRMTRTRSRPARQAAWDSEHNVQVPVQESVNRLLTLANVCVICRVGKNVQERGRGAGPGPRIRQPS